MGVINNRDWARVDVVTYGPEGRNENPVVPLLRMLADMETWPNIDFNIHEVSMRIGVCIYIYIYVCISVILVSMLIWVLGCLHGIPDRTFVVDQICTVDFCTNSDHPRRPLLQCCMNRQDRSMDADLQAMLCADALATSRSTIGELTMYHTRAKTVFLSSTCDGFGSKFGHTAGRLIAARYSRDEFFEVSRTTHNRYWG